MGSIMKCRNICVYCGENSTFYCNRCSDNYCSEECQSEDWNNHRFICFPLPNLIPIVQEIECVEKSEEQLEEPDVISIIREADSNLGQIEKCKIAVKRVKSQLNSILSAIEESEYEGNDLDENLIKEDVLEIGNDGLEEICIIKSDNKIKHQDTIECSESDLEKVFKEEEEELTDVLKQLQIDFFENDKNLQITEKSIKKKDDGLSKSIRYGSILNDSKGHFMMQDLKIHKWPNAKNIKVKLQDIIQHPNIISFIEDKKVIDDLYEVMENAIEKKRPKITDEIHNYLPKKNEIVLGHFNGGWYRACVLDPAKEGVIVLFIDYGNMELLMTDEIIPIVDETFMNVMSFEVCSRTFIVDNIPGELDEKQEEILDSKSMMITKVYEDQNGIYHCEIFGF